MLFSKTLKKVVATVAVAVIAVQGLSVSAYGAERVGLVARATESKVNVIHISGRITSELASAAAPIVGEDINRAAEAMAGTFSELIGIDGVDQSSFKEVADPNHIKTAADELAFVDLDGVMWAVGAQSEVKISAAVEGKIKVTLVSGSVVCMGEAMSQSDLVTKTISLTDGQDNYLSCNAGVVFGARKTGDDLTAVSYSNGLNVTVNNPSGSVKGKYTLSSGDALKLGVNKAGYTFKAVPGQLRDEVDSLGEAAAITEAQGLDVSYYIVSLFLANDTEDFLVSAK